MSTEVFGRKELQAYLARVMALLDHPAVLALQHDCEDYSGLVEETGARMDALEEGEDSEVGEVQAMLDLSTAHMPEPKDVRSFKIAGDMEVWTTAPDFGECRWTAHESGWVVYISDDYTEAPEWLLPAYYLAMSHNCMLINFDVDGPIHPRLPTWEW